MVVKKYILNQIGLSLYFIDFSTRFNMALSMSSLLPIFSRVMLVIVKCLGRFTLLLVGATSLQVYFFNKQKDYGNTGAHTDRLTVLAEGSQNFP